jgi:hypothetical protein
MILSVIFGFDNSKKSNSAVVIELWPCLPELLEIS